MLVVVDVQCINVGKLMLTSCAHTYNLVRVTFCRATVEPRKCAGTGDITSPPPKHWTALFLALLNYTIYCITSLFCLVIIISFILYEKQNQTWHSMVWNNKIAIYVKNTAILYYNLFTTFIKTTWFGTVWSNCEYIIGIFVLWLGVLEWQSMDGPWTVRVTPVSGDNLT